MPTMDEMFELRGEITRAEKLRANQAKKSGRMIRRHGKGPADKRCRDCAHFYVKALARDYRKCALFGSTGGPGTDWQSRWPTCGKFEPRSLPEPKPFVVEGR